MTTTGSYTTQERADALLARAPHWPKAYDKNGVLIGYSFRSSRTMSDGTPIYHMTTISPLRCSCEGFKHRQTCAHAVAVQEHQARHTRTVEAAQARYQQQATATTWRRCVRSWCEALVAPESLSRFCDHCQEKNSRLLTQAFGEE